MKTLDQYSVLIAERVGRQFDVAFREMCKDRFKYWRARLLKDSLEKKPGDKKYFTQTIYMPMENRLDTACSGLDCIPVSKTISVSKYDVPGTIRTGKMYEYLGAINGRKAFVEGSASNSDILAAGRFPDTVYWKWNQKVAVDKASIPVIMIQDVFDDPEAARPFECLDGTTCLTVENWIFPISGDLAQQCIQYIYQIDFGLDRHKDQKIEIVTNPAEITKS